MDGQLYGATYELGENGVASFGQPQKVLSTKIYRAMESLQVVYSEIIQEAGKRNASKDSQRLKDIMAKIQELLSDEAPDEKEAKEALKSARSTLKWLKEQAVMKAEDGEQFPATAYAYVPDTGDSSTWKLRLWESLEKQTTPKQLKIASTYLSGGGYSGKRVTIPAAQLSEVKRRIRSEYLKLNVEDEDIPKWVKEVETRELLQNFVSLTEAKIEKGRATVIVIKPGFNATEDRYYPAEMLKRDFGIFEGMKMYADHPTEQEDKERPERSIRDWVATLFDVSADESGVVTGIAEVHEGWLKAKLAALGEKGLLTEMGVSIVAVGKASKGTIDGKETLVIERLTEARSVDFVTEPGAGGVVTFYESDRSHDVGLIELAGLKERRPDLVKLIEADIRESMKLEVKKLMEDKERITELEGQNETLTTENTGLKDKITEAEKAQAKADAQAAIKEAVDKAELPDVSKSRLVERFKDADTSDGIEEAIKSEVDYIATLAESGKVRGLGKSKPPDETNLEKLRESAKRNHPDESDAWIETFITGRKQVTNNRR